jgi:hypothetical protein
MAANQVCITHLLSTTNLNILQYMDTEINYNLFVHIRKTNRQNKNIENLKKSPQSLCSWGVNLVEEVMAQSSGKKLFLINVKFMWLWFQKNTYMLPIVFFYI